MKLIDNPKSYDALSPAEKLAVQMWIALSVQPGNEEFPATSMGLKINLEIQEGVFLTNGDFKGAMLAAGYEPTCDMRNRTIDWRFLVQPACTGLHGEKLTASIHFCTENATPKQKRLFRIACMYAKQARLDRLQEENAARQEVAVRRAEAEREAREMLGSLSAARGVGRRRKRT